MVADLLLQFVMPEVEEVPGLGGAPGKDDDGHVVENVKPVQGGGVGGGLLCGLLPPIAGLVGDLHDLPKLVVVKLPAGDLLQLVDDGVELPLHILGVVVLDLIGVVEGSVKHDKGDVQLLGQVLIPLDHRVADVGGAQEEVRHGHVLRLAVLDLRIGQVHPGVRAQVRGIARPLRVGDEGLGVPPGADGGGVVFRIHGHNVHGGQQFLGGNGGAPTHQPSLGFGLPGLFVVFPQHLVHPLFGCELGRLLLHGQSSRRFRPGRAAGLS